MCFCCPRVLFFFKNSYFLAFFCFLKVTMRIYVKFPIQPCIERFWGWSGARVMKVFEFETSHLLGGPGGPPRPPRSCEGAAAPSRSPPPTTCSMPPVPRLGYHRGPPAFPRGLRVSSLLCCRAPPPGGGLCRIEPWSGASNSDEDELPFSDGVKTPDEFA